jgi:hypothetical protein
MSNTNRRVPHQATITLVDAGDVSDVYMFMAGSSIELSFTGLDGWDGEVTVQVLDEITRTWGTLSLDYDGTPVPLVLTTDLAKIVSDPLASDSMIRFLVTSGASDPASSIVITLLGYNSDHNATLTVTTSGGYSSTMSAKKFSRLAVSYSGSGGYDGTMMLQRSSNGSTWLPVVSYTGEQVTGYNLLPPLEQDGLYRLACEAAGSTGTATMTVCEVIFTDRVDMDALCSEQVAQRLAEDAALTQAEIAEANAKDFAMTQDIDVLSDADEAAAARDLQALIDAEATAAGLDAQVLIDADAAAAARDDQVLIDAAADATAAGELSAHVALTPAEAHAVETVWKDLIGDVSRAAVGGSPPTLTTFISGIYAMSFSSTGLNEVFILYHVPHDVKPNTRMIPHFHWSPNDATAGNVEWHFEYSYAKRDGGADDVFPSSTTLTCVSAAGGVAKAHRVEEIPDPNQGILVVEPDGLILARVYRDGAGGNAEDTYGAGAFLHSVDLHYQSDREGTPSRNPDYYT